ncbi:MAG: 4-(cytidine 5'-diphospho)-2-C-methyl-D-erythritol kinase [Spirochaetales bacterium]|nr:4-(cytidine 5'-diphospho)-2-C-methyl-D-erythritol kinase [Spirochaetales bacterium]MCF7937996.1 4-(cytidine 5'-diphospho)-2-C-methyl-D-erythritol kinase [Spirochaetales bacterium]
MERMVTVLSPAKVNLHLDVRGKRADGFHALVSIFQMVGLYDRITLRSLKSTSGCSVLGELPFSRTQNTITQAVDEFRRIAGFDDGLEITVEKRIPVGSGLGGGSSNAASTLLALNRLSGISCTTKKLHKAAAAVGSDVPFFLYSALALVTGRGDHVFPLDDAGEFWLLMIFPDLRIDTAQAYSWLRAGMVTDQRIHETGILHRLSDQYRNIPPAEWRFHNSFSSVLYDRYPRYRRIEEDLYRQGADFVSISGSGSTMYGVFATSESAEAAQTALRTMYPSSVVVPTLKKKPECMYH